MTAYEPVIGLEVHVQLKTTTKAFSGSSAAFGGSPNSQTDPPVLGLPGALPVLNRRAVEFALRMGLATGCKISHTSRFDRKHYFYPDLPKGYQISQNDKPLCEKGSVEFFLDGKKHSVRVNRIHMEEDAGKNTHQQGKTTSLVDLNRAGVALIEIVTEPDVRSAEEAAEYMRAIRRLVRYIDVSDGNMEEGSLRCDANVSLRPVGQDALGTRAELKNINSFRFVQNAIEHEIKRQTALLEAGEKIVQETRLWDADRGVSESMRSKEEANDYRYFPEPDLPPLVVDDAWIADVQRELPELPVPKHERFVKEFGISDYDAALLVDEKALGDYFVTATQAYGKDAKKISNWIQSELLREISRDPDADVQRMQDCKVAPAQLAALVTLIDDGTISGKMAKDVFGKMYQTGDAPGVIVERDGLVQVSDTGAIDAACKKVVDNNAGQVEKYRAGNTKLIGFFVGQVMKATQGKANPKLVNDALKKLLDG